MNTANHTSPSGEDAANVAIGEREASVEPLAWYVEWEVGAETWVDAFANESTAIDKGRLHNGKVIPCYPSAPDVVAISQGAALDAADALEKEYLRVANGQIKPAKMSLDPLVRAVQAIRDLRAALTAEKVAAEPVATCADGCQYSKDVGMWPEHSCAAKCMYSEASTKPIYQVENVDGDWSDVDWLTYESTGESARRIVYAAAQPAQTQVALTQERIRKIAEEHFWGGKCTTADDLEKAIVAALCEASLAAQPVSGGKS